MPEHPLFAVVLAAGRSSRFGSTKQLAVVDGEPLVRRAIRLAETVCGDRSVLVVGSDWKRVLAACGPQRGFFVLNDKHESGIASSIACGVRSVLQTTDAILLLLADQPLITADHLNLLIREWQRTPDDILISEYSGVQGPPVIFPAQCFDSLMKLEGDQGARSLLCHVKGPVRGIALDEAAVDIDTPEDLANL
jgi:molybdenum cofactor cytidylyltransferase